MRDKQEKKSKKQLNYCTVSRINIQVSDILLSIVKIVQILSDDFVKKQAE
jgi:hypothetical protein